MANDRIWLRCKTCKKQILFVKYFQSWPYVYPEVDALDAFVTEHLQVCRGCPGELGEDPGFYLLTETMALADPPA